MPSKKLAAPFAILAVCSAWSLFAADKEKKDVAKDAERPSYELTQPQKESLDLQMYQTIRDEALARTHVMEYASALMDGIGPRLTGSPNLKRANEWTRDQFTAMGCSNAHLEDWGDFGMGWQQLNTWVRMTSPDAAVFIAQAAPWSPATKGAVSSSAIWVVIKEEKDFEKYKGKLGGKIVFLGEMSEVKPVDKPLFTRDDEADLKKIQEYPLKAGGHGGSFQDFLKSLEFREKVGQFLAGEQAVAVVVPSREGRNSGGSGGTIFDDTGAGFGPQDIDRIFNPLFTTKTGGMGMGLAICRSIIEAHDGRLWAAPNKPEGAIFQFVLRGETTVVSSSGPRTLGSVN